MGDCNWPGWPLELNPYGKDFDLGARKRMVQGSRMLLPLLEKYRMRRGNLILEAGPFFEPLVTPSPGRTVVYADNDPFVIEYLRAKYTEAHCIPWDFNQTDYSTPMEELVLRVQQSSVDAIVASQLLNYIDYHRFFRLVGTLLCPGGLLFVNHSTDYGLPAYFSEKRPRNNQEVLSELKRKGFMILEQEEIPSANQDIQPQSRFLVVAKKR